MKKFMSFNGSENFKLSDEVNDLNNQQTKFVDTDIADDIKNGRESDNKHEIFVMPEKLKKLKEMLSQYDPRYRGLNIEFVRTKDV